MAKTYKRIEPKSRTANQNVLLDNPEFLDMYKILDGDMTLHQWAGALRNEIMANMPPEHTFGFRVLRLVEEGLVQMSTYTPCKCRICVED